jgi:phosphoribosylaminoimidazole-succinocarboxamide synthase
MLTSSLGLQALEQRVPEALWTVDLPEGFGVKRQGKVRDIYTLHEDYVLITTDRVSAFDRVLGAIPFKGQVLNQLAAWWFEQTSDVVQNHVLAVPDENVTIARSAKPLPIEVIVRGFITGVTSTSLWTLYERGEREPYGVRLPDGLRKNDPLPQPIITPTTKAEAGGHDERLTSTEILERGLVTPELWAQVEHVALELFQRGQDVARAANLVLVDTKYEFGLINGSLCVIDEIHTPDSSRYWTLESQPAGNPVSFDKEFLREWFAARGYRGEGEPPVMPDVLIAQVANRYIAAYERLTGTTFTPGAQPAQERIVRNLERFVQQAQTHPASANSRKE